MGYQKRRGRGGRTFLDRIPITMEDNVPSFINECYPSVKEDDVFCLGESNKILSFEDQTKLNLVKKSLNKRKLAVLKEEKKIQNAPFKILKNS